MGFWGTLGRIALPVASIAAAPFTGGTSLLGMLGTAGSNIARGINAAQPALGAIGSIAGAAGKGSADQRMAENRSAIDFSQLDILNRNNTFNAGMDAAKFQQGERDSGLSRQLLAAILGNGLPTSNIQPGNPAIQAAMGRGGGGMNANQLPLPALAQLLQGTQGIQAPTYQGATLPTPQTAGFGEKALGGVGLGSSLLGAILPLLQGRGNNPATGTPATPPITNPNVFGKVRF